MQTISDRSEFDLNIGWIGRAMWNYQLHYRLRCSFDSNALSIGPSLSLIVPNLFASECILFHRRSSIDFVSRLHTVIMVLRKNSLFFYCK